MNCTQASGCISALFDSQSISREVASHLADCPECRAQLNEYAEMGAELRDMASAAAPQAIPEGRWRLAEPAAANHWLRKWRGTMRIPRFAFALMLIAIFALSGGLALVKARSQASGPVLLLRVKVPGRGVVSTCTGRVAPEQDMCSFGALPPPESLVASLRFISRDGDRVQIGIRAKYEPPGRAPAWGYDNELKDVPLERYWMDTDKPLSVPIAGFGTMEIYGEFRDHEPPLPGPDATLDPAANELRMWSALLIRDGRILADMDNMFVETRDPNSAAVFYIPKEGRFIFALTPFPGSIQGAIQLNRIQFAENGHTYVLVMSGPVARTNYEHVWVLHQSEWRPVGPGDLADHLFVSRDKLSNVLSK